MDYRILGRTGLEVSSIVLGTDNFLDPTPEKESARICLLYTSPSPRD